MKKILINLVLFMLVSMALFLPNQASEFVLDEINLYDKILLTHAKSPPKGWNTLSAPVFASFWLNQNKYIDKHISKKTIKIFAGQTKEEITKSLAKHLHLNQNKLLKAYKDLSVLKEGDIVSGHYTLSCKADENTTMYSLFTKSKEKFQAFKDKFYQKRTQNITFKEAVIIASIIHKETYHLKEMPLISAVIHNRLKKGMKLQMDGTLNYGKYARTIVTSERIKNDNSVYNTYKIKGLPPHPIGTVSLASLKASLNPASKEYLYFMLNKNGSHDFEVNYKAHLAHIKAFRKKNLPITTNIPNTTPKALKSTYNLGLANDVKIDWGKVNL